MSYISPEYRESVMDRPGEGSWDEEILKVCAADRARRLAQLELCKPRPQAGIRGGQRREWMQVATETAAAKDDRTTPHCPTVKKNRGPVFLALDKQMVQFQADSMRGQVLVIWKGKRWHREIMSLAHGRAYYRKLLDLGYQPW